MSIARFLIAEEYGVSGLKACVDLREVVAVSTTTGPNKIAVFLRGGHHVQVIADFDEFVCEWERWKK